jgi:hypothetical protein
MTLIAPHGCAAPPAYGRTEGAMVGAEGFEPPTAGV